MNSWKSVSVSHTGKVRKLNEDSFIGRDDQAFWAVADGMGGHSAGDYASQQIVLRLSGMQFLGKTLDQVANYLDDNLTELDAELKEYAAYHQANAVGSTLVAMQLSQNSVGLAYWIGDSRLYQIRDGRLRQVSHDHSLVQELVDIGELTEEEAVHYPSKNIITRAVGANSAVTSEVVTFDYQKNDIYLLCSDGLTNELSDKEILSVLSKNSLSLKEKSDQLLENALAKLAADNITLILVEICQ